MELIEQIKALILAKHPDCNRMSSSTDTLEWYNGSKLQFTIRKYKDTTISGCLVNIVLDGE